MKMKNRALMILLVLTILISSSGCDNSNTKTLNCTVTSSQEGRNTTSDLEIKIKDDKVKDMKLTLNIELSEETQSSKREMMQTLRQKTDKVYSRDNGIEAVFDMNNSYFDTLGITQDASYSELKQVLELQGYTCEE